MSIKATIEIDKTSVSMQDAVWCTLRLDNGTRTSVVGLNPNNGSSLPSILLTDVATGETSRHAVAPRDGAVELSESVLPGKSFERRRPLQDFLRWQTPGTYELKAHFTWFGDGGGEAISDAIRVQVQPSYPRTSFSAPLCGGTSGMYCTAWVSRHAGTEPGKDRFEAWFGQIDPDRRPRFTDCVKLADLKSVVQPIVSVPPNATPIIQWIAWIDGGSLYFLPHRYGKVCAPEVVKLEGDRAWIVPPLLVHSSQKGEELPGAIALLYEPNEQNDGGRFIPQLLQLQAKGGPKRFDAVELSGIRVQWAATAYLSTLGRHTFIAARGNNGECLLKVSNWSALKPPSAPIDLATWETRFIAGHVMVTRGDFARGVILGEKLDGGSPRYSLYQWAYTQNGEFLEAEPIPLSWPCPEGPSHSVVRICEPGTAYAVMRADNKAGSWYFCLYDGRVKPAPKMIRPPVDILFRYGDDPTIMYVEPNCGFRFVRPT